MALTDAYVLPTNRIADVFSKIRDGQAPDQVTVHWVRFAGVAIDEFSKAERAVREQLPNASPPKRKLRANAACRCRRTRGSFPFLTESVQSPVRLWAAPQQF